MKITEQAFQAYRDFIERYCKQVKLCKDCSKWEGKCTHPNHPKDKLFIEDGKRWKEQI
jgi:hypothetical protein